MTICDRDVMHHRHDVLVGGEIQRCPGRLRRPGELLPIVAGLDSAVRLELGVMSA